MAADMSRVVLFRRERKSLLFDRTVSAADRLSPPTKDRRPLRSRSMAAPFATAKHHADNQAGCNGNHDREQAKERPAVEGK